MNNEINQFHKKVEEIPVPDEELETVISSSIKNTPRKTIPLRNKALISIVIAATLFCSLVGSAYFSPVVASVLQQIPGIGSVLSHYDIGLEYVSRNNMTTEIGETVTDQGISITVTDIYYDYNRFVIGYVIDLSEKTEKEIDSFQEIFRSTYQLTIDQQPVSNLDESWHREGDSLLGLISVEQPLPEKFTAQLTFSEVLWTSGEWSFNMPVERNNTIAIYEPNQTSEIDDYQFAINELTTTPSTIVIDTEITTPLYGEDKFDLEIYYDGEKLEKIDSKEKKRLHLSPFNKDIVRLRGAFEPIKGIEEITVIPTLITNMEQEQLSDLAITVDLAPKNIVAIKKDTTSLNKDHSLRKIDFQTYAWNVLEDEWANYVPSDPAQYQHAAVTVFGGEFSSSFYRSLPQTDEEMIKPTAFINKANEKEAYIIYKEFDGTNHLYQLTEKDEWEIVNQATFKGKAIEAIREAYQLEQAQNG
ncbi:DUF4179 domain-containing protein [Gracilibacillus thailandensis]|uniref:DUF4179 domain-containing protein n=1 Tax=Gracilibacillus thailandensis TaxID=563735 RepID=A0A6N7R229_9BACI|nr:DUF4179 domain-containing protein [Gracilibacillus thailandensis]MRI67460.1 DUF4179 domain-containing protein [Gracilibacillus thailandensis]